MDSTAPVVSFLMASILRLMSSGGAGRFLRQFLKLRWLQPRNLFRLHRTGRFNRGIERQ